VRSARWSVTQNALRSSISELQRSVRRLEHDIGALASIAAAEVAVEARKNSWSTWLLSPLYTQVTESEDEKGRKDRARQERKIEKDSKERRLCLHQAQSLQREYQLKEAEKAFVAANLGNDQTIAAIAAKGRNREIRERLEREKMERERLAKTREQEQIQREEKAEKAREAFREQQARAQATKSAREEEYRRIRRSRMNGIHFGFDNGSTHQDHPLACDHGG
jgi:hypothetical protein